MPVGDFVPQRQTVAPVEKWEHVPLEAFDKARDSSSLERFAVTVEKKGFEPLGKHEWKQGLTYPDRVENPVASMGFEPLGRPVE